MKMRFSIAVLMITLVFVSVLSVFPLVRADSTIVYHKDLQSDEEHFYEFNTRIWDTLSLFLQTVSDAVGRNVYTNP